MSGANSSKTARQWNGVNKDVRKLIRKVERAGGVVAFHGSGHLEWSAPGITPLTTPCTGRGWITMKLVTKWARLAGLEL